MVVRLTVVMNQNLKQFRLMKMTMINQIILDYPLVRIALVLEKLFDYFTKAPPPPPSTIPREEISDSDDDISNVNGFRIQAIDNTSVQDYSNIMVRFYCISIW